VVTQSSAAHCTTSQENKYLRNVAQSLQVFIHSAADFAKATWRTSSYSGGQGNCVEVATDIPNVVPVRDTKHRQKSPVLAFNIQAWQAFLTHL
jgi:hypothetical protein